MINRIKSLFAADKSSAAAEMDRDEELHMAAASLLVEAACLDGEFDDAERKTISAMLSGQFELDAEEVETLIGEAELAVEEAGELYAFTKVIKDRYSNEERIGIIEMLWEVAFADGNVDHFEANLIRRVGGLIFVSDKDRGIARQRVIARLGITENAV